MEIKSVYGGWMLGLVILFVSTVQAADTSHPQQAAEQIPEEVIITGKLPLYSLREKIEVAEVRMYELFNEVNDVPMFEMSCNKEPRKGSKIKEQECQPKFVHKAREGVAEDVWEMLFGSNLPGMATSRNPPAEAVISFYLPKFEERLKKALQENPAFLEAVIQRHALQKEYDERRTGFSGKDEGR